MITCPWCGTNYKEFQSNCRNCGGILPAISEEIEISAERLPVPPPSPPRPFASSYIWRLVFADGVAIAAAIVALMGAIFFPLGFGLTLALITSFVGIPFLIIGVVLLGGGLYFFYTRYCQASLKVNALQNGLSAQGRITAVEINDSVKVSGRSPWTIAYIFEVNGQKFQGKVSTFNFPGTHLAQGKPAWVLYLAENPGYNVIYPHP